MVFGLPRVEWFDVVVVGDRVVGACYQVEGNVIGLSLSLRPVVWFALVHELGHWLLCRLPRCDLVYNLNLRYDYLWNLLFKRVR